MAPKIPTSALTIALNGFITDTVFKALTDTYLPAFQVEITSGYRTPDENEKADGTENSAHMYNLARDFVLKDASGNYLSPDRLEKVYEKYIKPNWHGYSKYNPPKTGKTGWIHVNLDRGLTRKTGVAAMAVTGVSLAIGLKKIIEKLKKGKQS